MKVVSNRHVGIIVNDLDKMIDFYQGLGMSLKSYGRMIESGDFIDNITGSKDCILQTAKLTIQDNALPEKYWFVLELILVQTSKYTKNIKTKFEFDVNKCCYGVLDIAFTVDDIHAVIEYIIDKGGSLIGGPASPPIGHPSLHSYLYDIEGNVLHIAQNINHQE